MVLVAEYFQVGTSVVGDINSIYMNGGSKVKT